MKKRRVAITGLGVIAANGIGVKRFWDSVKNGKSGVTRIESFDTSPFAVKIAAEIKNFRSEKYLDEKTIRQTAKFGQYALIAAGEALGDAGLSKKKYNPEKLGISISAASGGTDYLLDQYAVFLKKGCSDVDTFIGSVAAPSAAARAMSLAFHAQGPCMTFASSCASAADAIGYGFNAIKNNDADIVIAGGTESPLHPMIFAGFCLARVLSYSNDTPARACRPFDTQRNGTVLGEGAAILILEELEHARKRNAVIYAELAGFAASNDSYHIVTPDPEGTQAIRAMNLALKGAGVKPETVGYINAHGTGTLRNDIVETLIIKKVFGAKAYKIPVSSTKPVTGHLLGAAGAVEALITALAVKNSIIPPTINLKSPDPQCGLDYVPREARHKKINAAVSNSFGFGGFNAALVFKKYE